LTGTHSEALKLIRRHFSDHALMGHGHCHQRQFPRTLTPANFRAHVGPPVAGPF
jgi:hypothetical protein